MTTRASRLNADAFTLTGEERTRLLAAARASVDERDAPYCIFWNPEGAVRLERWRGEKHEDMCLVVMPSWAEVVR